MLSLILVSTTTLTLSLFAQNKAFDFTSPFSILSDDQGKMLNYVNTLPKSGTIKYINWGANITNANGDISISLSNDQLPITFSVIDAYYHTDTEYALFGKNASGNIALYVTPQGAGGTIDIGTDSYNLYPMGLGKGLLIKNALSESPNGNCGKVSGSPVNGFCDSECGNSLVDVLALITPAAQTWLDNNFGVFASWILFVEFNNINGAFANSNIPGKRVRVKAINFTPNFALNTDIGTDLNNLINNTVSQNLANNYGADIRGFNN